jgi:hypothetical protein
MFTAIKPLFESWFAPVAQVTWSGGFDCLKGILVFLLFVAPIYLTLRFLVKMARIYYGFDPLVPDDGPPIRVCDRCNNTVLEPEYAHCPYCGELLPPPIPSGDVPGSDEAGS